MAIKREGALEEHKCGEVAGRDESGGVESQGEGEKAVEYGAGKNSSQEVDTSTHARPQGERGRRGQSRTSEAHGSAHHRSPRVWVSCQGLSR